MELSKNELSGITKIISKEIPLKNVLTNNFPNAEIAILIGYENISEPYVHSAFFNEVQSKETKQIEETKTNKTDSFYILKGTIQDLNNDKILYKKSHKPIDSADKRIIYISLQERLRE